jgi:hypothetical protein
MVQSSLERPCLLTWQLWLLSSFPFAKGLNPGIGSSCSCLISHTRLPRPQTAKAGASAAPSAPCGAPQGRPSSTCSSNDC